MATKILRTRELLAKMFAAIIVAAYALSVAAASEKEADQYANPAHKDQDQELMRLRNEGVAHFESGVAQKKAIKVFEDAVALKPKGAIENYNLAVAYRKQNRIDDAIPFFNKAIEIDSQFAHPYYSLGLVYREQGKVDEALSAFVSASKIMPAEASSHYQISRLYRELGDDKKTIQSIVNTLQLDPYHTGAIYQLYLYHQNNGDKEKAQELFKEFSRLKKAFGRTRLEINADESQLSKPIDSRQSESSRSEASKNFEPKFSTSQLFKESDVNDFEVADFNRDGFDDIVAISADAHILFLENNQSGQFSLAKRYPIKGKPAILDLQAARFKQSGSLEAVVATSNGVFITKTLDVLGQEKPKGKSKKERAPFLPTELNKEVVQLSESSIEQLHLIDVDHDGDLDIVLDRFSNVLLNDGDAEFSSSDAHLSTEDTKTVNAYSPNFSGSDFRNLVMVDFVLRHQKGSRRILRDEMGGRYSLLDETRLKPISDVVWSANADMNNDGLTEIVSITGSELLIDYNQGGHRFENKKVGSGSGKTGIKNALIGDFNNDGLKDIFASGSDASAGIWVASGAEKYQLIALDGLQINEPLTRKLRIIDADNDGLLDIVAMGQSGQIHLLKNQAADKTNNNWVKLNLNGLRSSPDAHFVQVEVRYGDFYSKYEAQGSNLHIPLGAAEHAEVLRITWPNGFVENKFKIDAENLFSFDESERISGSCPSIYAWDGSRYQYVTDAFISGPMGVPMGSGNYFPVDHDEYIKIPASLINQDGDSYKVSIVEELKEVTYLDQIRIYAVDRPADVDIYPNEYLNPPDFPEFKLHVTRNAQPLLSARDHHGEDILALVSELDYQYPYQFIRTQYTGFTTPHSVEFELPTSAYKSNHLKLFLTGWFYYFDSTSLVSASQNDQVEMQMPKLQAFSNGQWETIKTIGIPSGKDKTIVIELGGLIPAKAKQLRIVSNIEVYWDRILFDEAPSISQPKMVELPLKKAKMALHGFSKLLEKAGEFPQPDRFDYHDVRYQSMWNPLAGRYTRYGKVGALLGAEDSRMAVLGSGDEVILEFDAVDLEPLKKGWQRDFILYLNGYVKDGDKYTVHAGDVNPMPFAGMQSYPYSPADKNNHPIQNLDYQEYLKKYQTREPIVYTRVAVDAYQ